MSSSKKDTGVSKMTLTCKNILDIIKTCKESEVVLFELGDLRIEFKAQEKSQVQSEKPYQRISEESEEVEGPVETLEQLREEVELGEMILSDPDSFIKQLEEGDITLATTEDN